MKIVLMAFLFAISYIFGFFLQFFARKMKNFITKPIKNVEVNKNGISFLSTSRHKLKVGDAKLLELKNAIYLKQNAKTIVIKNANMAIKTKNYLYFTALGDVKIIFNTKGFYKYFNIKIKSSSFDLEELKQNAIDEMLNNLFNLNNCSKLKEYLKIVVKILNIHITNDKIFVKRNDFNLTFTLIYKLNNTIKIINIGESI